MEPCKPTTREDIAPKFERIGDAGWADEITTLFHAYDAPLPTPCSETALSSVEDERGITLPSEYRLFMATLGPVAFGYAAMLPPLTTETSADVWFHDRLPQDIMDDLQNCLTVCDLGGSGDFLAVDLYTGACRLLDHTSATAPHAFESFSEFARWALVDLYVGHYGWPDESVEALVSSYKAELSPLRI